MRPLDSILCWVYIYRAKFHNMLAWWHCSAARRYMDQSNITMDIVDKHVASAKVLTKKVDDILANYK